MDVIQKQIKQIEQIENDIKKLQEKSAKQKDVSEILTRANTSYSQTIKHYKNVTKLMEKLDKHYTRDNYLALIDEFDFLNKETTKHREAINRTVNLLTNYAPLNFSTSLEYQRLKWVSMRYLQDKYFMDDSFLMPSMIKL